MLRYFATSRTGFNSISGPAASLLLLSLLCVGCEDAGDPSPSYEKMRQEVGEAVDAVGDYSSEKKEQAVEQIRERMKNLDGTLADLKTRSQELSGKAKEQLEKKLEVAREKRQELEEELGRMSEAGGEAWTELQAGVQKSWEQYKKAYEEAKNEVQEPNEAPTDSE